MVDAYDLFRRLSFGAKFDKKRFENSFKRLEVGFKIKHKTLVMLFFIELTKIEEFIVSQLTIVSCCTLALLTSLANSFSLPCCQIGVHKTVTVTSILFL